MQYTSTIHAPYINKSGNYSIIIYIGTYWVCLNKFVLELYFFFNCATYKANKLLPLYDLNIPISNNQITKSFKNNSPLANYLIEPLANISEVLTKLYTMKFINMLNRSM